MPVNEIYMSNTKTLAILAILTAATLVIGVTFAATTQSAFAAANQKADYSSTDPGNSDNTKDMKKDPGNSSTHPGNSDNTKDKKQDPKGKDKGNNGNTVTEQENEQKGTQSGFDNDFEQSASNVICTHPEGLFACLSTD